MDTKIKKVNQINNYQGPGDTFLVYAQSGEPRKLSLFIVDSVNQNITSGK